MLNYAKVMLMITVLSIAMPVTIVGAQSYQQPVIVQNGAHYSDAELQAFAGALLDIQQIINQHRSGLASVTDGSEAQSRLVNDVTGEAEQAIVKRGLNVDRFNEILQVAQVNPEIAGRIEKHLGGIAI